MSLLSQNIAHFTNGMACMFFILVTIQLYKYKNRSHLMSFFFWEMLFFAFIELKNVIYLIDGIWENEYISNISLIIDMCTVPVTMMFMFELISPGWVTLPKTIGVMLPSVFFLFFYILFPYKILFSISLIYTCLLGTITLFIIFSASSKYDNYVKKNFSFNENMSISWIRYIITPLYIALFVWTTVIWNASWIGDAIYYLFIIIIWVFIYHYSLKHVILEVPSLLNPFAKKEEQPFSTNNQEQYENFPFAQKLDLYMENDCLYLNPKLTITDLATVIGTNRTYLSEYLNRQLNTTFYEYINAYRIKKACCLLISDEIRNLEDIAESCGFNSLSTFRRSFYKETGKTPMEYKKKHSYLLIH